MYRSIQSHKGSIPKVLFSIILIVCTVQSVQPRPSEDPTTFKRILEAYDHEFLSAYRIVVDATLPQARIERDGVLTSRDILTGNDERSVLIAERKSVPSLTYQHDEQWGTYDLDGNFTIAIPRKEIHYLTKDQSRTKIYNELFVISRENRLLNIIGDLEPSQSIFDIEDDRGTGLPYHWRIMALGRGYSRFLNRILDIQEDIDILSITAQGKLFRKEGEWRLWIESAKDYLVRRAEFSPLGGSNAWLIFESVGTIGDEFPIALQGSYHFRGDPNWSVIVLNYERRTDIDFLNEAFRDVDFENVHGAKVWDFRASELPLIYSVP